MSARRDGDVRMPPSRTARAPQLADQIVYNTLEVITYGEKGSTRSANMPWRITTAIPPMLSPVLRQPDYLCSSRPFSRQTAREAHGATALGSRFGMVLHRGIATETETGVWAGGRHTSPAAPCWQESPTASLGRGTHCCRGCAACRTACATGAWLSRAQSRCRRAPPTMTPSGLRRTVWLRRQAEVVLDTFPKRAGRPLSSQLLQALQADR